MADVPRFERKTAFRVYSTVNQAVPGANSAVVNFNTIDYDLGNNFDLATDIYVVPLDGIYSFDVSILAQFDGASTSRHLIQLEDSASTALWRGSDMSYTGHAAGFVITQWLNCQIRLTQGLQVRLRSTNVAGSATTLLGGSRTFNWTGHRIQAESRTILN